MGLDNFEFEIRISPGGGFRKLGERGRGGWLRKDQGRAAS